MVKIVFVLGRSQALMCLSVKQSAAEWKQLCVVELVVQSIQVSVDIS